VNQEEIDEAFAEIVKEFFPNEWELREQAHYGFKENNEEDS
jgi:hypothetical protein